MALDRTNNRGTSWGGPWVGGSGPTTAVQWSSADRIYASLAAFVSNRVTSWGDSHSGGSGPTTAIQW